MSEATRSREILYAKTREGALLPILDLSNPAFRLDWSDAEQRVKIAEFVRQKQPLDRLPGPVRELALRFLLRKSALAKAIRSADGTFLSGMNTYLLKLGATQHYPAQLNEIDRRIAAALPVVSLRLRVQDIAELLADAAMQALRSQPARDLQLLNIAGGPAIDSLNALILVRSRAPELLTGRAIAIDVLDLDRSGPLFGRRALAELQCEGGPLHGLAIEFRDQAYDWSNSAALEPLLAQAREHNSLLLASSEGALFEYGSDQQIVDNLQRFRNSAPAGFVIAGSVTRADEPTQKLRRERRRQSAVRPRGLPVFRGLVERAGFRVERVIERAFSDQVALVPVAPSR